MSSNVLRLGRTKTVRGVCRGAKRERRGRRELVAAFQSQIKEFR